MEGNKILLLIVELGGASTVLYGAYKGARKCYSAVMKHIERLRMLQRMEAGIAAMPDIKDKLDKVLAQVAGNGGHSLRDAVMRIDQRTAISDAENRFLYWENDNRCLFSADATGMVDRVNATLLAFLGREKHEVIGQGWFSSIASDHRDNVREEYYSCIEEKRNFVMDFDIVNSKHQRIPVTGHAKPLRNHSKQIIGYSAIITSRP